MNRPRILVVDDEAGVRDYLVSAIRREGYEVQGADSKKTASLVLQAWRPDAAAVDLHLSDGSGLELLPVLRQANDRIRAVLMTGFGTIRSAVDALKAGAVDYLCKPLSVRDVIRTLDPAADGVGDSTNAAQMTLEQARWEHIQRTLAVANNNISESARRLGIRRQSLQRMLQKRPPFMMT